MMNHNYMVTLPGYSYCSEEPRWKKPGSKNTKMQVIKLFNYQAVSALRKTWLWPLDSVVANSNKVTSLSSTLFLCEIMKVRNSFGWIMRLIRPIQEKVRSYWKRVLLPKFLQSRETLRLITRTLVLQSTINGRSLSSICFCLTVDVWTYLQFILACQRQSGHDWSLRFAFEIILSLICFYYLYYNQHTIF